MFNAVAMCWPRVKMANGPNVKGQKKTNSNLTFDNFQTDFPRWILTIAGAQLEDSGQRRFEYKKICRVE